MRVLFARLIFCLTFLASVIGIAGCAAREETEAEQASRTQRELTAPEIDRLRSECSNVSQFAQPNEGQEPEENEVSLPQATFLTLFFLRMGSSPEANDASISKFEDLPNGGIGRRDYCDFVELGGSTGNVPFGATSLLALRLRPGLNLLRDYPEASRQITENRQLIQVPARRYLVISGPKDPRLYGEDVWQLAMDRAVDRSALWFQLNGTYFLPTLE